MAAYTLSGTFITSSGGTNGAVLDAWRASRFGGIPAQGQTPPSGGADSASVSSGTGFGGPGAYQLYVSTNEQFYVRAQYSGTTYWSISGPVQNTNGVAGGEVNSYIQDQGAMVFNVKNPLYGATGNGTTDDTSAINSALTACAIFGGGTVFFPAGQYKITSALSLPVSATETNYLPGSPAIFQSFPIRFTGMGAGRNARGDYPEGGSQILFDPSSNSTFLTGLGSGNFEFDHIALVDTSSQQNLFFRFTNTISNIHDNLFCGNEAFSSAWTDLVTYGVIGATTPNGGTNAIFQGYGTSLENNNLVQMRHLAFLCNGANQITIKNNAVCNTCGTNGADGVNAPIVLSTAIGNVIENNDLELIGGNSGGAISNGYNYGIYCANGSSNNTFKGNGFWDGGPSAVAGISFDSSCYGNKYFAGVCQTSSGGYLPWAVGATNQQTSMGGQTVGNGTSGTGAQPYVPIGGIIMWTGPAAIPYGWFLCDGASFSTSQFPELFAAIGTNVLPNFNGNFPNGTNGAPGGTGGSAFISTGQLPPHTHGPPGGTVAYITGGNSGAGIQTGSTGYGEGINTGSTGGGGAYLPPYISVNFIMRGI